MLGECHFELNYKLIGDGLVGKDFEFDPKIAISGSWGDYDRAIIDDCVYYGSILKKAIKKGTKLEQKVKKTKLYKKAKDRYKKEKQGVKEGLKERKESNKKAKAKRQKKEAKKQKKKEEKKEKKKSSLSKMINLNDEYDSSESDTDGPTESEDEMTSDEDDDNTDEYESESSEGFSFNNNEGGEDDDEENKCKLYKESKTLGPFIFENNSKLRGDEYLWFYLYIHTKHSGIKSLDKRESKYINRTQQAGVTKIPINAILIEIAKWLNKEDIHKSLEISTIEGTSDIKVNLNSAFFTPKLAKIEYHELMTKSKGTDLDPEKIEKIIINKCTKSKIIFELTIKNLTKQFLESYLEKLSKIENIYNEINTFDKYLVKVSNNLNFYIPFGSPLHEDVLEKSMSPLINNYIHTMFNLKSTENQKKNRFIKNNNNDSGNNDNNNNKSVISLYQPSNKQVENLHLAYYSTLQGDQPVISYLLRNKKEFDERSEDYFLIQLIASLKRKGLGIEYFIKTVEEQFKRTDSKIIHNFINCVEAVYNIGTFAASQSLYTSDFRYNTSGKQVNMDSWDMDISQGISNCDDCEGMGSLALEILDCIKEGRKLENGEKGWISPSLQIARKILWSRSHCGVAGTVNDAFINADGQKISNKKLKDLPIIGDKMDTDSTVGGHFYGLAVPNATLSKWIKNSLDYNEKSISNELSSFLNTDYKEWEFNQQILVLEGTGNIDPYILPFSKTFEEDTIEFNKRKHLKELSKFIKSCSKNNNNDEEEKEENQSFLQYENELKNNIYNNHKPNELFIFNNVLTPESTGFYIKNPKENRRISRFYKDVVHILSKDIFLKDSSFSQGVFCYKDKKTFGVDIGDILRDLGNKESNIMITRPLIPTEKDLWKYAINPLINTIKNQQPRTIIGNWNLEEESKLISQRLFKEDDISPPTTKSLNCEIFGSKSNNKKTINITSKGKSYVIDGKENNPILYIKPGIHYTLNVNAEGHPFWILSKNNETNSFVKYKGEYIENNGTEKGIINLYIHCDNYESLILKYKCGNHPYMTGSIAFDIENSMCLSSGYGNDIPKIDYRYKKPKWHFEDIAEENNLVLMKFYCRSFHFDKEQKFLTCLKNEISFLKKNKGIQDYVIYEQKFFPQGESLIEIHLMCKI